MEENKPPHQVRVHEEKTQLDERIGKLSAFMAGAGYQGLQRIERELLAAQRAYMSQYSAVLGQRIALWEVS